MQVSTVHGLQKYKIRHWSGASHINAHLTSRVIECQLCNIPHTEPKNKKNVKIYRLKKQNTDDVRHIGCTKLKRCSNTQIYIGKNRRCSCNFFTFSKCTYRYNIVNLFSWFMRRRTKFDTDVSLLSKFQAPSVGKQASRPKRTKCGVNWVDFWQLVRYAEEYFVSILPIPRDYYYTQSATSA